jgi:hypothetical protein
MSRLTRLAALLLAGVAGLVGLSACDRTDTVQRGYRGLGMTQMYDPARVAALAETNSIPPPEDPADPESPSAEEAFVNVQVLKDLSATELSRLMQAMSTWVAPEEGCDFCHNPDKLESDEKYPKVVARRMLQMTRAINTGWKKHVGETGVTCWTCHRGQAVPSGDWFASPTPKNVSTMIGNKAGQNMPAANAGNAALPYDPLSTFLITENDVRVQGNTPLKTENRHSIKQAEWTYSLMIYMSNSLGVNCTYCHNTRAMARWDQSTPQRATAWHGIRMVRNLNSDYLIPLKPNFPVHRLSAEGDGPKVGCATCHKGTYKPLYGQSMLADYQSLAGVGLAGPAPAAPLPEGASPLPEGAAPSPEDEAPPPDGAVPSPAPTAKKAAAKPSN